MSMPDQPLLVAVLLLCCTYCSGHDPDGKPASSAAETTQGAGHGTLPIPSHIWEKLWSGYLPNVAESVAEPSNASSNTTTACTAGWNYLKTHWSFTDLELNVSLEKQALDAFGKPGAGLLEGNVLAFGSYDECLSIDHTQYCNVPVVLVGGPVSLSLARIRVAMCLPQECTTQDVLGYINDVNVALENYEEKAGINISLLLYSDPKTIFCETDGQLPYNAGAIVMIFVCAVFASLVLTGTGIDCISVILDRVRTMIADGNPVLSVNSDLEKNDEPPEERSPLLGKSSTTKQDGKGKKAIALEMILAFSLFKTVPTILSTDQPAAAITCIHGIRTISMFWVILGHTHVWGFMGGYLSNTPSVFKHVAPRFSYQPVANGFLAVDSFLFLSGLLLAYLTLRHMNRKRGKFPVVAYYVHRYLRLTPSYAFVLFFYWFLTMHLTSGPDYHATTGVHSPLYRNCEKYWWTNLLYINNLYPWKLLDECMDWTWYLANDMQFFVISPLFLVLLFYTPILAFISIGIFLVGCFVATGAIVGYYEFDASFLGLVMPTGGTSYNDEIYIKPYARIAPYLVGIVLGFLFYRKVRISLRFLYSWLVYALLWCLAITLGMAVAYGLYNTWHGHTLSTAENVMYITFSRFTWGLALALLVFICHNGYGWVVNSFLSMKFWIPLSRLSFNAYLVHEIVLIVLYGNFRNPVYYTDVTMTAYTIAAVVLSYGVAGVVAACVEFPLGTIEATLFKILGLSMRESTRRGNKVEVPSSSEHKRLRLQSDPAVTADGDSNQ